ncbi:MAG TPA: methyltransferase domain-containing protein [Gemmatimonadaceae bacterium]|nr:methyltransferase domain-containing protein [Gemmatimonadaceae bacterium]
MSASPHVPPVPAVLRLVQLAVLGRWRATSDDLYRAVVRAAEVQPRQEVLVSGCGDGAVAEWLAVRTEASVTGVDPDDSRIEAAEERARTAETVMPLHFQQAPLDDLPHESAVFDVAIGEPPLSAAGDPARAVAELARVTKPMGVVVLLQPTWTSDIAEASREATVERLGLRPHLLVEWKQMLRDAGIVELQVQDWTDGPPAGSRTAEVPAVRQQRLTLGHKVQIAGRAIRRARGLRGARSAVEKEKALLRELSRERAIGFQLIKGVKWPHPVAS